MVSILLAVYNGEAYLKKSIESVLNQTYNDFELLIGFNGTIDESKNIVSSFDDKRIRIFDYGMDCGKSKTLNKLINEANGEWLAMQDDDDIWIPSKLESQMVFANSGGYDVIGTKIFYCNEIDEIVGCPYIATKHKEIYSLSMNGYNQIPNTSAIFKKSITKEIDGWDEKIVGVEDFDFWLKLLKKGCIFVNVREVLVLHRLHNKSNFNTQKYNVKKISEKYNSFETSFIMNSFQVVHIKYLILNYLIFSRVKFIFCFFKLKFKMKL